MARKDRKEYNDYMREYMLKRYHKRRSAAIDELGGVCVLCGRDENLELDHVDPTQKSFPISRMWSVSEKKFWAEVDKCQLLCGSCHEDKSIQEQGLQKNKGVHGHPMNYKRYGCRCALCTEAMRKYNQNRWRKRKRR